MAKIFGKWRLKFENLGNGLEMWHGLSIWEMSQICGEMT